MVKLRKLWKQQNHVLHETTILDAFWNSIDQLDQGLAIRVVE